MYTQFDKLIVALVMAVVGVVNYFGLHFGVNEATVNLVITAATPVLVWLVPNLPKDQA